MRIKSLERYELTRKTVRRRDNVVFRVYKMSGRIIIRLARGAFSLSQKILKGPGCDARARCLSEGEVHGAQEIETEAELPDVQRDV